MLTILINFYMYILSVNTLNIKVRGFSLKTGLYKLRHKINITKLSMLGIIVYSDSHIYFIQSACFFSINQPQMKNNVLIVSFIYYKQFCKLLLLMINLISTRIVQYVPKIYLLLSTNFYFNWKHIEFIQMITMNFWLKTKQNIIVV